MPKYRITRTEPDGPLRSGLKYCAQELGDESGAKLFLLGVNLANTGLDVGLDLQEKHYLGDTDVYIPKTTNAINIQRQRGEFSKSNEPVLYTVL